VSAIDRHSQGDIKPRFKLPVHEERELSEQLHRACLQFHTQWLVLLDYTEIPYQ